LATLVEVAELANEVRCFKYWSVKSPSEKDIILAEYVDVLHFISGFCVQYNIHPIFDIKDEKIVVLPKKVLTKKFNNLFQLISRIKVNKNISKQILNIYKQFIKLGFNLGYTIDDITSAYTKKHAINHERQKTNY
jgi:dimeric dUTPase (all-alpha-NTP-PPase superfamily)